MLYFYSRSDLFVRYPISGLILIGVSLVSGITTLVFTQF